MACSTLEIVDDAPSVAVFVVRGAGIGVGQAEAQGVVEEDRELARRRGHDLGLADAGGEPAIEGAKGRLGAANTYGARRSSVAARLAERRLFELSSRPPETLLPGARHNHDAKCLAVGHLLMSSPHSPMSRNTV